MSGADLGTLGYTLVWTVGMITTAALLGAGTSWVLAFFRDQVKRRNWRD